ncbi:MFS transporter [Aerococcaceae bacterium 50-4]
MSELKARKFTNDLSWKHRIGYAAGDAGGVLTLVLVQTYMTRYITNTLQIPYAILSVLLLIWNIWDMVNDPMMGTVMDKAYAKTAGTKDKFRPWILRSIPLIVLGLIAFYSVPTGLNQMTTVAMLFIFKIIYELGYTMMNIAMGSLIGGMATNDIERTTLSSARGMGSTVGGLIGAIIAPQVLVRLGETSRGFMIASIITAILGGIIIFVHYAWTEERNKVSSEVAESKDTEASKVKVTDILNVFKKNRAFLALSIHSVIVVFGQTLYTTSQTYVYADHYKNIGLMSFATTLMSLIMVVILLSAPKLVKTFGSTDKLIRSSLVVGGVILLVLFGFMYLSDVNDYVYMIGSSIGMALIMMSVQLQWGLVSESTDYNEYLTGKRTEGAIYGTFSLTRRIGQTIAQSLSVAMIGWIGYSPEIANAGGDQTLETLAGLQVMNLLIPGICAFLSWICFRFIWNITGELRAEISAWKDSRTTELED